MFTRLLFTQKNGDFSAISETDGMKLRGTDLESGASHIGQVQRVPHNGAV